MSDEHHSPHGPVLDYYTEPMIQAVADREAWALDRFGFTGPGSHALRGVA
jgi:hypothetical protein